MGDNPDDDAPLLTEHTRGLHLDHPAEDCDACVAERTNAVMANPLNPSPAILAKLASLFVHSEESRSEQGHTMDVLAISSILADPELNLWVESMKARGLVPARR